MSIIIHFGMPKTGSSAIQAALFGQALDSRFHYVSLGTANQSGGISTIFRVDPENYHTYRRLGWTTSQIATAKQNYEKALLHELTYAMETSKVAIISGEDITNLRPNELRSFYKVCRSLSPNVRAVGYIRSPKAFMESAIQQKIKMGEVSINLARAFPRYRQLFQKFDKVFGRECTSFWKFDPSVSGDIVSDFCKRIGLPFKGPARKPVNEGLSLPALRALCIFRRHHADRDSINYKKNIEQRIIKNLADMRGPKLYLHSSIFLPRLDEYNDEVEWMENRLEASLREDVEIHDSQAIMSLDDFYVVDPVAIEWLQTKTGDEFNRKMESSEVFIARAVSKLATPIRHNKK